MSRAALACLALLLTLPMGSAGAPPEAAQGSMDARLARLLPPLDGTALPLAYGPYRAGQAPWGTRPDTAQLTADLTLIAGRTGQLRSYGACAPALAELPGLAAGLGLQLWQGIDLGPDAGNNKRELACYGTLAAAHPNIAVALVGGETLLRKDLSEAQLIDYLRRARTGGRPVSTAETWFQWCNAVGGVCQGRPALAAAVDLVVAHAHPYWEEAPIEQAAATVVAEYLTLRALYPAHRVVIGETGWPTAGKLRGRAVPGLDQQRRFLSDLARLARDYAMPVILFEAFDEPWKAQPPPAGEGDSGAHWGLFDVQRRPKHTALKAPAPPPPALPTAPSVRIDHPAPGQPIVTRGDCGVPVIGRANTTDPGARVIVDVLTDGWYPQTLWFRDGQIPVIEGRWGLPFALLAGRAPYDQQRLRARLVNAAGEELARHEIGPLVRAADCGY